MWADVLGTRIGARVAALAEEHEVLVSSSVPPLVAGSAIRFEVWGDARVEGVDEPWAVFAVTG